MNNENIGELGRAFIAQRADAGIDFDVAWEQWQHIQRKLMFIVLCPEVRCYDDRRIADAQERKRLRDLAKSEVGDHIRSSDVSLLGRIAAWIDIELPVRPYHMDRGLVAKWLTKRARSLEYEIDESMIEEVAVSMEQFAVLHSLSAVPPKRLIGMYVRHVQRVCATSFTCMACNEEIAVPVDHSAGELQEVSVACPKCHRLNRAYLSIDRHGDAQSIGVCVDSEAGGGTNGCGG